jgi:23S rRNA G2445 N2-methylase RlmL
MPYRFATERQDYSDYARGRVLYGQHGHPAYPVRLASEIWQRCVALLRAKGRSGPYQLYDPCCGSAYLLTVIAMLHRSEVAAVTGSDVDPQVLETARRNLSLLSRSGMEARMDEIRALHRAHGKASHAAALESALRLREQLDVGRGPEIETRVFEADVMDARAVGRGLAGREVDVLIADLPYGQDSQWKRLQEDGPSSCSPVIQMLDALLTVTSADSIVALSADKGQKLVHPTIRRVERFRLGKRQVALLRPHSF